MWGGLCGFGIGGVWVTARLRGGGRVVGGLCVGGGAGGARVGGRAAVQGPLVVSIRTDSHERRNMGLKLDTLAVDAVGGSQRINLLAPPVWAVIAWNGVVYLSLLLPASVLPKRARTWLARRLAGGLSLGAAAYYAGPGAVAGVVNLVTRPIDDPTGTTVSVSTTENRAMRGRASTHYNWSDKGGFRASVSGAYSPGRTALLAGYLALIHLSAPTRPY